jgi:hypothetical protein
MEPFAPILVTPKSPQQSGAHICSFVNFGAIYKNVYEIK